MSSATPESRARATAIAPNPTPGATVDAGAAEALTDCVVTPSLTEGPYYADVGGFRQDITEGLPGVHLLVQFRVVEAGSCAPVPGVVIDLWHTDAAGRYSGFTHGTTSETFLRGKQVSDAAGLVVFQTIYPGWYRGRTVHAHFKVSTEAGTLTSQLFFPDEVTAAVYAQEPYVTRGPADTTNEQDSILRGDLADHPLIGTVTATDGGLTVTLTVAVAAGPAAQP